MNVVLLVEMHGTCNIVSSDWLTYSTLLNPPPPPPNGKLD